LKASDISLLPYNKEDKDKLELKVQTTGGVVLTSPVGIGPYLCHNGRGVDGVLQAAGIDEKSGHSTFIEVGPCSPERTNGKTGMLKFIAADKQARVEIDREQEQFNTIASVAANLLRRQHLIAQGKVTASIDNLVGVNLQAGKEIITSAPYLAHLDFVKGVREFTELADYAVINLA
jgi:hypothetical protein